MERNTLILDTAYNAAKSLLNSYKQTYKVLKEYDLTKNESLLVNSKIEEINLDDADTYFEAGNFAHPLLDALEIINDPNCGPGFKLYRDAEKVLEKALKMREKAINKAKDYEKENEERERNLLKYNDILEEARRIGREEQDFNKALKMIKKAITFMPKEIDGRWGLATAYHHSGKIDESIKEYKKLIKDFPDNTTFKFEYGQVLIINGKEQEGLQVIAEVMGETEEYDNFFSKIGDIYNHLEMPDEAISAYESYLDKFSFDYKIWKKLGSLYSMNGKKDKSISALKKCQEIKPDYKKDEIKRLLVQTEGKIR